MATHSSILAWRIPTTEEPGGLQSMGSQKDRHEWSDLARMHTHTHTPFGVHCSQWVGFPSGSVVENLLACEGGAKDTGSIPGSGRSPGGRNGNPLQCSCLDNSMDRGSWRAIVHEVAKSQTRLSGRAFLVSKLVWWTGCSEHYLIPYRMSQVTGNLDM